MTKSRATGKETVVRIQPMLVNLIILDLEAKQLHWNVTGALFRPLHEMFDEFVEAYRGWYDEVAERIRALDAPADARPARVRPPAAAAADQRRRSEEHSAELRSLTNLLEHVLL